MAFSPSRQTGRLQAYIAKRAKSDNGGTARTDDRFRRGGGVQPLATPPAGSDSHEERRLATAFTRFRA